ncbi:hypothetical protein P886_3566 [Alteromonadaceae bacterium 2753L.S.0a.02]|nr:hypothetical protein P886_3566 [Alteromonadaceae bacterium 2753L.S.0a.02]
MASIYPTVGSWYQDSTTLQLFEVVAVDEDTGSIEVQFDDGDIGEYELDSWGQLSIVAAAAPEDPSAGYESNYNDSWGNSDSNYLSGANNPIEFIEPDSFLGYDDLL